MTLAKYFADKIERAVSFYEGRLSKADDTYLLEVRRFAARRFRDPVVRRSFHDAVDPRYIRAQVGCVRALLQQQRIVEADKKLDDLKNQIEWVEQHLRQHYLKAGVGKARGGRVKSEADAVKRQVTAPVILKRHDLLMRQGFKAGEADKRVGDQFNMSGRTVRKFRTGK